MLFILAIYIDHRERKRESVRICKTICTELSGDVKCLKVNRIT